ncbi:cupin [Niastella koreensis]|uniref:Cupin 2 conserved barrel domain protein n=2 Tax=Niastella koreensis TaxID=354356 RepID=G8TRI6_NIAKG|nr:cupin domain-containing protein [Niastella koreensis]AEW01117.1 Cupin 2 conserved barrel domain protein [Niastella koreensis GR20-10]OQP41834.1 cupin [Niastella koreensis]
MNENKNKDTGSIFPIGDKASPEYFAGAAWVKTLVANDDTLTTIISNVVFEPGARNHWHTHPAGQILICTEGTGYYQEKGKPIQKLYVGDVVRIPPGVEHWHGASPTSRFTHIAINVNTEKGVVNWLKAVTDEEYNKK